MYVWTDPYVSSVMLKAVSLSLQIGFFCYLAPSWFPLYLFKRQNGVYTFIPTHMDEWKYWENSTMKKWNKYKYKLSRRDLNNSIIETIKKQVLHLQILVKVLFFFFFWIWVLMIMGMCRHSPHLVYNHVAYLKLHDCRSRAMHADVCWCWDPPGKLVLVTWIRRRGEWV